MHMYSYLKLQKKSHLTTNTANFQKLTYSSNPNTVTY